MTATALLVLSMFVTTADAGVRETVIVDVGTDLPNDPYTHTRGLTEGRIENFRELYVQPASFADSLKPKAQPIAPPVESVDWAYGEGNGAGLELRVELENEILGKTKAATVQKTLEDAGHTVAEADGKLVWTVTVGEAGLLAALSTPLTLDEGIERRLVDVGVIKYVEAAAEPEVVPAEEGEAPVEEEKPVEEPAEGEAAEPVEVAVEWMVLGYTPEFAPVEPGKGSLVVENGRSSWATVVINGDKVGVIGPYATGYVHNVPDGSYDVNFTVANGYSWTVSAGTVAKVYRARTPQRDSRRNARTRQPLSAGLTRPPALSVRQSLAGARGSVKERQASSRRRSTAPARRSSPLLVRLMSNSARPSSLRG